MYSGKKCGLLLPLLLVSSAVAQDVAGLDATGFDSSGLDSTGLDSTGFDAVALPILQQHCVGCHSGWFPDAGVDLSSREEVLAGGPSGPLVVPGEPDKGWLMHSITKGRGRQRMPPDGPPLDTAEVATLRRWIEAGAR